MRENGAALAKAAHEETGLGRYEDKVVKNALVTEKTPGLEDLYPVGRHRRPRPLAHRAGAVRRHRRDHPVHEPDLDDHLQRDRDARGGERGRLLGPPAREELLDADDRPAQQGDRRGRRSARTSSPASPTPSIESAQELMRHPGIRLLVVTGGGAVVKAAMASGKRAICAGPGQPARRRRRDGRPRQGRRATSSSAARPTTTSSAPTRRRSSSSRRSPTS